jgi:hypothetical protein
LPPSTQRALPVPQALPVFDEVGPGTRSRGEVVGDTGGGKPVEAAVVAAVLVDDIEDVRLLVDGEVLGAR